MEQVGGLYMIPVQCVEEDLAVHSSSFRQARLTSIKQLLYSVCNV